jgi:ribosome maturation factor RimP
VSGKNVLVEKIEQLSAPILAEHNAELVDLQFVHEHGSWVLRYFLDKPDGITLDDCAALSRHLGQMLDESEAITQSYSLEVSSPGVYRPLRKEKDYLRFVGERVDVTLFAPINGRRHFRGQLESVETGAVIVKDSEQRLHTLPLADVAKATLDPEIEI